MCSDNWLHSITLSRRRVLGLDRVGRVVKIRSDRNQSLVSRIRGPRRWNRRPERRPPRNQLRYPEPLVVLIKEANRGEEFTMPVVGALGDAGFVDEFPRAKRLGRRKDRLKETTS